MDVDELARRIEALEAAQSELNVAWRAIEVLWEALIEAHVRSGVMRYGEAEGVARIGAQLIETLPPEVRKRANEMLQAMVLRILARCPMEVAIDTGQWQEENWSEPL